MLQLWKEKRDIPVLKIDPSYEVLQTLSTSKGTQQKWRGNGQYVKKDLLGYESLAEVLVTQLLKFTKFAVKLEFVKYHQVVLQENGIELGFGCVSKDFKEEQEEDITVGRILEHTFMPFSVKYEELLDLLNDFLELDVRGYLDSLLYLDSIILNEDRHFHNISFLKNKQTGRYRPAPVFDSGLSLLSDTFSYPMTGSYKNYVGLVKAKPFFTSFERQIGLCAKYHIPVIDYDKFMQSVDERYKECRAFQVLQYQLQVMEGKSWIRK